MIFPPVIANAVLAQPVIKKTIKVNKVFFTKSFNSSRVSVARFLIISHLIIFLVNFFLKRKDNKPSKIPKIIRKELFLALGCLKK